MKFSRRTFLAAVAAASSAAVIPKTRAHAARHPDSWATLIDLTLCDGCAHLDTPACVSACRTANTHKFPEPDPAMLKDNWPQRSHDDWSSRREVTDQLTPYNWTFVQSVRVTVAGHEETVNVPRRCMHCDNPPCVKLCPFGTLKQDADGPVHVDPSLCFGGAKCKSVCPWDVPQRQAGVGVYTYIDPLPVGGGVMFKCDLCRDRLARGKQPACVSACPRQAIQIGRKSAINAAAAALAKEYDGHIYGLNENGGTSTLYVSRVPFDLIDQALRQGAENPDTVMGLPQPDNILEKTAPLATAALIAPFAGVLGAFAATLAGSSAGKDRKTDQTRSRSAQEEEG